METVTKEAGPKYFYCNKGPMGQLHAKFHGAQAANSENRFGHTFALYYIRYSEYGKIRCNWHPFAIMPICNITEI